MIKKLSFDTSKELKALFNEEYDRWRTKHRGTYEELAARCGLSASYLGQIGRYGRVPSKSALILLALNFDMKQPQLIFDAAGISERWPLDRDLGLRKAGDSDSGFLSVRLDMNGLADALRDVVRAEIRPKSLKQLTRGKPLRIGINAQQGWLFAEDTLGGRGQKPAGLFPEICEMLGVSLQCPVELSLVPYSDYLEKFARDELDVYGPIIAAPNLPSGTIFTKGLYRIGMSALYRKRQNPDLASLPAPKSVQDILDGRYQIAVLKNSRSHLLANTRLKRSDDELILCSSHEEALERILMKGIRRPAHLFFCNSVMAIRYQKLHKQDIDLLFATPKTVVDMAEDALAVRADWQELATAINDFLAFLIRTGSLKERLNKWFPEDMQGVVDLEMEAD